MPFLVFVPSELNHESPVYIWAWVEIKTRTVSGTPGPGSPSFAIEQGCPIVCHGGPGVCRFLFQPIATPADLSG